MTFGITFHYRCAECTFHYEYSERDGALFMSEAHIYSTNHRHGIFKKTELDDDWNQKVVYVKNSEYRGPIQRFKFQGIKK